MSCCTPKDFYLDNFISIFTEVLDEIFFLMYYLRCSVNLGGTQT